MSLYTNKTTMSLLNMTNEMYRKNIEISRITKACTMLLMSGLSTHDINPLILERCLSNQQADGGFVGNTDTVWNIKLLSYFPEFCNQRAAAIKWLLADNGTESGFGRSKRDMHRIPVTGLALYLLPELASPNHLNWLESAWITEQKSLTYKAAYTLMAFHQCAYTPAHISLIEETKKWLVSQQENTGGFAPWRGHPVGENVYCTAVALVALLCTCSDTAQRNAIECAYRYLCQTQLNNGIWPYHEIEDGAGWGLFALAQSDCFLGSCP